MFFRRSAGSPPVIVELVGTPGAGKTTLARDLVSRLEKRGVRAATPVGAARDHVRRTPLGAAVARLRPARLRDLLLWKLFYALGLRGALSFGRARRHLVLEVVRGQLGRPIPAAVKRHLLFWFFQLGGRYHALATTAAPGEVLVVDDGFLHRTVGLGTSHLEKPDPSWVAWYVEHVPRPHLVVHVAAPVAVCQRRVHERGVWPHLRHLAPAEIAAYIGNADRGVSLAVARARERGWTVITVDNGIRLRGDVARDLETVVECIVGKVATETVPEAV